MMFYINISLCFIFSFYTVIFRKLVSLPVSRSTVMHPHLITLHFEAYNSLAIMAIVATMPPIIAITIDSANISIY